MKIQEFQLGMRGTATFSTDKGGNLLLTAAHNGEVYDITFLDSVSLGNHQYLRSVDTRTVSTLSGETKYTAQGNQLLAEAAVADGITLYNRFTVSQQAAAITMETWVKNQQKVYDCAIVVGRTQMALDGFRQLRGGEIPGSFPVDAAPPYYAFQEHLTLEGENRYLQIRGGTVWYQGNTIDAHLYSDYFNDDLSWFGEENPLRTVYAFEEIAPEAAYPAVSTGDTTASGAVVSGSLQVPYRMEHDGVSFLSGGNPYPMAAMLVREIGTGKKHWLDTQSGWETVTVKEREGKTEFLLLDEAGEIGLRLTAEPYGDQSRISWSVEAINTSRDKTILWCSYPRLYRTEAEFYDLFVPRHGGSVETEFNRRDCFQAGAYPAGLSYPMAYYALYPSGGGKGLYYAIHDSTGGYKDLHAVSDGYGRMRLSCKFCAPHLGEPGNGFRLPGKAVWQQFTGDWFDATEIYRDFLETECDWLPVAGENGRENIPLWLRDLPFWIMDWMPNESDAEEPIPVSIRPGGAEDDPDDWYHTPIRLRKELGVPFGYHLYNWHGIPFNNDYPHYFPVKKALPRGLEALKAADIRVMPYINALLWDNRDRGNEDYQFSSIARPGAVKLESGEVRQLSYASHESDGELVKLSPMCPSYGPWREKLQEIVSRLFTEYDMDAVYLDQTAAHVPHACMDKTHSHAPGGGSWWSSEYRALLRALNEVKPAGKAFTSESNAEVYASELDGFLSWAWITVEHYVPAFMRLYGGKIVCFGRNANAYMKANTTYWKYHLAQALVAGEQMGWINSDFTHDPNRLAFVRKLTQMRYVNREFFRGARPMRPPVVEAAPDHKFACGLGMANPGVLHQPYLCVGVLENGRKRKLIAVNLCTEEITDSIRFVPGELQLHGFSLSGDGSVKVLDEDRLQLCVAGDGLLVLDWEV